MKKYLLILLLFPTLAQSATLVTDCSPDADQVTMAQLQFDGGVWQDVPALTSCLNYITCSTMGRVICYDITSIATGPHIVKGRFGNAWGWSIDSPPFTFNSGKPGYPSFHVK